MADISLNEGQIKDLFNEAIIEVFQERRDVIYDVLAEVIEDFALVKAIQESESSKSVTRKEVFQTLEGAT